MKKNGITRGEKMLYLSASICLLGVVFIKIFFSAGIGNYKMSNEELKYKISNEKKDVESLVMQVNEITSFDNIKDIAKELGLAYNNDNIIVIGD